MNRNQIASAYGLGRFGGGLGCLGCLLAEGAEVGIFIVMLGFVSASNVTAEQLKVVTN